MGKILGVYAIAYIAMMLLTIIHVMWNWQVLGYQGFTSLTDVFKNGPRVVAYQKTIKWQPLYSLSVFSILSIIFFAEASLTTLFMTGLIWLGVSIIFDSLFWVCIPQPWQMTKHELFVDHQPWVSLCYLFTAIGPLSVVFIR